MKTTLRAGPAGPATKGEETLLIQSDLITRAAGMTNDQVAKSLDFDRQSYNLVRNEKNRAELEKDLADLVKLSSIGPAMPPAFMQRQIRHAAFVGDVFDQCAVIGGPLH